MNVQDEIRKINHNFSILDFDLKLNDNDIEELDNYEINKMDSLLDFDFFYDSQFNS